MYTLFSGKLTLPYPRTICVEHLVVAWKFLGIFDGTGMPMRTAVARKAIVKFHGRFQTGFDLLI